MEAGGGSWLLVQVQPAHLDPEKLRHKLQLHFQSLRNSGGGECSVQVQDPQRGVYRVEFACLDAKKRVKAHGEHCLKNTDVSLNILPDPEMMDTSESSLPDELTNTAKSSLAASYPLQLQKDFEKQQHSGKKASDHSTSNTRKIFLSVTATLNTDLLPKEARDQVMSLFPTLTTDSDINCGGIEKVTGDYEEVEKLYRYFERHVGHSQSCPEILQPESQNGLEEKNVNIGEEDKKTYYEGDMQVPPAIFEYFYIICQEQVKDLEQKFHVKLVSKDGGSSGMTSVRFTPVGSPDGTEKAQEAFVESIQKLAMDLTQEKISFIDSQHCAKAQEKLNTLYKNVLVKKERDTLIICGPSKEIAAAKGLVKGKSVSFPQRPACHSLRLGIEVDADVFDLLEPGLVEEINTINQKYDSEMSKKRYINAQKMYISFKLRNDKNPNELEQAYESFRNAYGKALKTPMEKVIPVELSVDQKRKVERENPSVVLKETKEELIIYGYPEDVCNSEKSIKKFLKMNVRAIPADPWTPDHSSNIGATSGASAEQNNDSKQDSFPSSALPSPKAIRVAEEEMCAICMDKICQKEVLPKCKHEFCKECIDQAMRYKPICPVCNMFYGLMKGNQPPGEMHVEKNRSLQLPGYEGSGTIIINYSIPKGCQMKNHPNPGRRFTGAHRTAYLPDNKEGREILQLLKRAFDQKLIFTVGQSRTTGMTDVVTWNDIHHKTSIYGGPERFGYPDPHYLNRVREELKAKGIE